MDRHQTEVNRTCQRDSEKSCLSDGGSDQNCGINMGCLLYQGPTNLYSNDLSNTVIRSGNLALPLPFVLLKAQRGGG